MHLTQAGQFGQQAAYAVLCNSRDENGTAEIGICCTHVMRKQWYKCIGNNSQKNNKGKK